MTQKFYSCLNSLKKVISKHKNLYIIVHSGIIHNIQKVETTHMDKMWYSYNSNIIYPQKGMKYW